MAVYDKVADLRAFLRSDQYKRTLLSEYALRGRFMDIAKTGAETPDVIVEQIHKKALRTLLIHAGKDLAKYEREKSGFEQNIWPVIKDRIKGNLGVGTYALEEASTSKYIFPMMVDAIRQPAMCMSLAYGIGHSPSGDLENIPLADQAVLNFQSAETTIVVGDRLCVGGNRSQDAERIILLGGGMLFPYLLNDYPLGEKNQEIVVYDLDGERLKPLIQQFLRDKSLEDYGIDYRSEDFRRAFADESQQGYYDLVILHGVSMYYHGDEKMLFGGAAGLARRGGNILYDVLSRTPSLAFAGMLGWKDAPGADRMHMEPSVEAARELARHYSEVAGLKLIDVCTPPSSLSIPAGVLCEARKI